MELADYLNLFRKRWLSIVAVTLLGAFAALAISLALAPQYTAQAQVFVATRGGNNAGTGDLLQGANFTVRQVRSYTQLVSSPRVLQPVISQLALADSPVELAERVHADSPLDTVLINVSADETSPFLAAEIANATANSLANVVRELESPGDGSASPVEISTVREAAIPDEASAPNTLLNLALGTVVGLVLGVALAVLREVLDTRIRDASIVEQMTDAPVLGTIAYDSEATQAPLIVQGSPQSLRAEAFRRLRTNLQFLDFSGRNHALVITSSLPTEGKSTTTVNLAITLAQAGQRVALVDADLRRPSVADYLGVEGSVGLTTVLIGRAELDDVIQPWGNGNIDVITSGRIPPNPSELLGSAQMADLVEELNSRYDVVLIDTSPLLPVTDGAILARLVGGAIIVVGANTVHKAQVAQALQSLETVGAPVLGVIVNRVQLSNVGAYGYYQYTSATDGEAKPDEPEKKTGLRKGLRAAKQAIADYPGANTKSRARRSETARVLGKRVVADPADVEQAEAGSDITTYIETVTSAELEAVCEAESLPPSVSPYVNPELTPPLDEEDVISQAVAVVEEAYADSQQLASVSADGPSFDEILAAAREKSNN